MDLVKILIAVFIFGGSLANANVCDREEAMVQALEKALWLRCSMIKQEDLADIEKLDVRAGMGGVERITKDLVAGLVNIRELRFISVKRYASLQEIEEDSLEELTNLEKFGIYGSQIQDIPVNVFRNQKKLKELSLTGSLFKEFSEETIAHLAELNYLSFNDSSYFDASQINYKNFPNIKTLKLTGVDVSKLPDRAFEGMKLDGLDWRYMKEYRKESLYGLHTQVLWVSKRVPWSVRRRSDIGKIVNVR